MHQQHRTTIYRHSKGFTLIELIVTLSIATIISVAAIPAMYTIITKQQIRSQAYELVASINLTRSEAIKRGHPVMLCKSEDGQTCEEDIEWDRGWLIFADTNGNKKYEPSETIIRTYDKVPGKIQITNSRKNVAYRASGRLSSQNGSFRIKDRSGEMKTRKVIISRGGRVRTEDETT